MLKSYLIRSTLILSLLLFYPITGEPYAQIEPTPVVKQLVIDAPAEVNAGDNITIRVTLYINDVKSYDVEGAYLTFDDYWIGQTNKDGVLNYTVPKSMKGMYRIIAKKATYADVYRDAVKTMQVSKYVDDKLEIQCFSNEALIKPITEPDNIVIVIDSSGSTTSSDPTTGISFMSLINENAIGIVQNVVHGSRIGVVAFGGRSLKTELLPVRNENDREELEGIIRNIRPNSTESPTDIDKGLIDAEELLKDINGKKEIIVISDGNLPRENFESAKNKLINLTNNNNDIKIHFIQVILSYTLAKEPSKLYDELAKFSSDGHAIVLSPGENINSFIEIAPPQEPFEDLCSTKVNITTSITVTTSGGFPMEGVEINLDNTAIGMTNQMGNLDYVFGISGFFNITTTKPGYEKAKKIIQVLPAPTITQNPTQTVNQTINPELLIMSNQSKETPSESRETSGFEGVIASLALFAVIIFKRVSL